MASTGSILLGLRRTLLPPAAILAASVGWISLASAQTVHSGGRGSVGQPLSSDLFRLIKPGPFRQDNYRVSDDGTRVTFRYRLDLTNGTNDQLSEVDLAMAVVGSDPKNELFRSKAVRFTDFTSYRIPHQGSIEAHSSLAAYLSGEFTIPAQLWTSDVRLNIVVTRAIASPEGGDLHDLGNLIQFMRTHTETEVRTAFEHDPKLALVKDGGGTNACLAALATSTPGVVRQIMDEGGDIHSQPGGSGDAMFLATASDQPENLQFTLQQGFSVNADAGGTTPLEVAIVLHANKSVVWLITHGANVNAVK